MILSRHAKSRLFVWFSLCLFIISTPAAPAAEVLEDFIGRRQTITDMPKQVGQIGRTSLVTRAKGSRGVIIQASATFQVNGDEVSPKYLQLFWDRRPEKDREFKGATFQPAIRSGDHVVVFDRFGEEDVLRLAAWVFRSSSTVALSLLPESHDDRAELVDLGYVNPDVQLLLPKLIEGQAPDVDKIGPLDDLLVHPVLDTPNIVGALGYIDFADGLQFGPATNIVLVDVENEGELLKNMNRKVGRIGESLADVSYTNSDVDARFRVNVSADVIYGEPLRYHWALYTNETLVFHAIKRFRSPTDLLISYPDALRVRHGQAIGMFRIAAVFRAFRDEAPQKLVDFINEAIDRR